MQREIACSDLRFLVIPATAGRSLPDPSATYHSRNVAGVLVIGNLLPANKPFVSPAYPILPYRRLADRLYLPADAELVPHVEPGELKKLLEADSARLYVWHPVNGLLGYDAEHVLRAADLLGLSEKIGGSWDGAQIGESLNDRIRTLSPQLPENPEELFNSGRDDIGQQSDDIESAPRSPDEITHPGLKDAAKAVSKFIAAALLKVTDRLPSSPTGSPFLARLHAWAEGLAHSGQSGAEAATGNDGHRRSDNRMSARRENEIRRLLNLLENDPDQGLRFALPFGGDAHRGKAPPSDQLGERLPDFNRNQLNFSGRTDSWELPWKYQVQLQQRYRELALREIRLGRHRRAAYIYAHLLHDFHSAASALESGGHHFDAAAVYRDQLRIPLRAAQCLKSGGYWEEAAALYCELKMWVDAADVLEQLQRTEEARELLLQAVRERESRGEFISAAELALERVRNQDLAEQLLWSGWTRNSQSEECLRRLVSFSGNRGDHANTIRTLGKVAGADKDVPPRAMQVIRICSEMSVTYPDQPVRDYARQQTFRLSSALLQDNDFGDRPAVLKSLAALARQDRLLQTDTQRFLSLTPPPEKRLPTSVRSQRIRRNARSQGAVEISKVISAPFVIPMPMPVTWNSACFSGTHCHVLGVSPDGSAAIAWADVSNSRYNGSAIPLSFCRLHPAESLSFSECVLRSVSNAAGNAWLQTTIAGTTWNSEAIRAVARANTKHVIVVPPLSAMMLDICPAHDGTVHVLSLEADEMLCIHSIRRESGLRSSVSLAIPWLQPDESSPGPFRLVHDGVRLFVLTGKNLWQVTPVARRTQDLAHQEIVEPKHVIEFDSPPINTVVSHPQSLPRLACAMEQGVCVVWPLTGEVCRFAHDLVRPLVTCTFNGTFVVCCRETRRIDCFRLSAGQADLVASLDQVEGDAAIVGLTPACDPGDFLAITQDGRLTHYRIPAR